MEEKCEKRIKKLEELIAQTAVKCGRDFTNLVQTICVMSVVELTLIGVQVAVSFTLTSHLIMLGITLPLCAIFPCFIYSDYKSHKQELMWLINGLEKEKSKEEPQEINTKENIVEQIKQHEDLKQEYEDLKQEYLQILEEYLNERILPSEVSLKIKSSNYILKKEYHENCE